KEYNFNNKQVTGISRILLEIDPSYRPVGNLRLWASFRYFSRQYASISNILFFNPRWETFGGVDYTANRHLTLSALVVNFLNQTGASGSISGSELMTDGSMYNNVYMSGSYLRPLTFELKASVKF
ncbi:MAG: TonB-dependent receptor, partial [Bacteroidales bacterium]|nr:TonB-dependent receptor [Bacteroidales bacterium]